MNKALFCGLAISLVTTVAQARQTETLADAVQSCSKVRNSLDRLVCYDRVVKEMNRYAGLEQSLSPKMPVTSAPAASASPSSVGAAPVAAATVAASQSAPAATSLTAEQAFGMEAAVTREQGVDKITSAVASVGKDARDNFVVTLENGQVWKQTDSTSFRIKEGQEIYVERGALGAFYLSREDVNRRVRVVRIDKPKVATTAAAPKVATAATAETSPAKSNEPASAPAAASAEENFGREAQAAADQIEKLYATVTSVDKDARKKLIVTLDNGQVWRQTDTSSVRIKEGQTIYVERGALGSFYMSRDDMNRRMLVKRSK